MCILVGMLHLSDFKLFSILPNRLFSGKQTNKKRHFFVGTVCSGIASLYLYVYFISDVSRFLCLLSPLFVTNVFMYFNNNMEHYNKYSITERRISIKLFKIHLMQKWLSLSMRNDICRTWLVYNSFFQVQLSGIHKINLMSYLFSIEC